jgi:hypothetical protein
MKDATGELSMTAVAVVAIAAIALLFRSWIWPGIQATIQRNTYCSQAHACACTNSTCNCNYFDENGNEVTGLKCPNNQKTVNK